ncbi:hypothetical protein V7O66_04940 [Methanolobus sp. ZRKC3]|uniref:hypothetical protein n=1 Tax=Methanolobus sp. ZRKC3 TaxID=3125786 RepID=UPI003245261B
MAKKANRVFSELGQDFYYSDLENAISDPHVLWSSLVDYYIPNLNYIIGKVI